MAQKQGGKGKQSSPSDIAYWKRINPTTQAAKRLAKHRARMGLTSVQMNAATALQPFQRAPSPEETPRVIFSTAPQAGPRNEREALDERKAWLRHKPARGFSLGHALVDAVIRFKGNSPLADQIIRSAKQIG